MNTLCSNLPIAISHPDRNKYPPSTRRMHTLHLDWSPPTALLVLPTISKTSLVQTEDHWCLQQLTQTTSHIFRLCVGARLLAEQKWHCLRYLSCYHTTGLVLILSNVPSCQHSPHVTARQLYLQSFGDCVCTEQVGKSLTIAKAEGSGGLRKSKYLKALKIVLGDMVRREKVNKNLLKDGTSKTKGSNYQCQVQRRIRNSSKASELQRSAHPEGKNRFSETGT